MGGWRGGKKGGVGSKGMRRPVRALAFRDVNKEVTTFFRGRAAFIFFLFLYVGSDGEDARDIDIVERVERGGCCVH